MRIRVIDRLRQLYPDPEWSWRYNSGRWENEYLHCYVRDEAVWRNCCPSGDCEHFRTQYRITWEPFGPMQWLLAFPVKRSEIISMFVIAWDGTIAL